MPVRTLIDGRKVNLPEGLTEAQQTNLVLKAFPDAAALAGMSYDIEREYDFNTGVKDFDLRFGNALAGGNPDEIKAEFDNQVGKGNWGVTDFGEVYLTPDGLRAIGQEPKDDRNVLIDSIETDLYDLVDIIPEVVVGTGALAAEFIPVPGTSVAGAAVTKGLLSSLTGRGLIARSARAGFGDAVANVGLEGVQKLRGTQRESLGEVLQDAGTEGLVVGLGSIVLGAPFSAVGGVANRIKSASKDMAPGTQAVRPVQLEEMMEAQRRVAAQVGDDDAMLLSLRTLVGEEGTIAGNILTKIEGVGTKQLGDSFAKKTMDFMNKYRSIVIESRRLGDDELTTLSKLKANLNQSEQQFGKNIVKELSDFNSSAMGKLDNAASTLRGFKDLAQQKLLAQYRQSMKAFDGDEYYGQFKNLDGKIISEQRLANFLTRVSDEAGLSVDDVVNAFGPDSPLHRRITSRIKVKEDGNVVAVKAKRNKKGEATNYQGSSITVQDLLDADKQIRKQSYAKRANFSTVRRNLEISRATQNQISRLSEVPASFQKKLAKVNREYSQFANIYRGKNGLFDQIAKKGTDDSQAYLQQFVNGKEGAEFATLLDKLDRAFGPNAIGSSIGLETKEQILGALGVNFIRENKQGILSALSRSPEEGVKAAKKALERINVVEDTMIKRVGNAKAKQAMKQLFQLESMSEYKKILNKVIRGTPDDAAKAADELGLVMGFKEAQDFIARTAEVGANLSRSNLDEVVAQLRSLDALDKRNADFYRDLMFSENWGRVVSAMAEDAAPKKNAAIKAWADDWIDARSAPNGVENMTELFGKEIYEGMDDLALNIRGALNIDPNSGALSVAEQPVSLFRKLLRLDFQGALKPLSFIYGTKQFAPGTKVWTEINKSLADGKSPQDILKSKAGFAKSAGDKAQKSANAVMAGRNGLFAASLSSYMNEADQVFPTEDEVPVVAPKKVDQVAAQPQPQNTVAADTGIAAIQQIANMIQPQNIGTAALEEGAAIARSAA